MLVNKNTDFFRVFTKSVSMDQFVTKKVYEMNQNLKNSRIMKNILPLSLEKSLKLQHSLKKWVKHPSKLVKIV